MKIVKRNPEKKRGLTTSSSIKTRVVGAVIFVGMGLSAILVKETAIGHEPAKEGDPMWKKVALSALSNEPTAIVKNNEDTIIKLAGLTKENERLRGELTSRGMIGKRPTVPANTDLEKMAMAECNFVGLDPVVGFAFIHAESRWYEKSINVNKRKKGSTVDYGLMQLNNAGGELGEALGKTLTLSDGRKVKVTTENYKTDTLLNLHIGLSAAKEYLDITKNVYAAYSMYNCGTGAYYNGLKMVVGLDKLGMEETCDFLEEYGFGKGAYNIRTNFSKSFEKYLALKNATK